MNKSKPRTLPYTYVPSDQFKADQMVAEINGKLAKKQGQPVMLIFESSRSYTGGIEFSTHRCRHDSRSIIMGVVGGQELIFDEHQMLVVPTQFCLQCHSIDFNWGSTDANLVKQQDVLNILNRGGMTFSIGDIIWSVEKREQAFSFRLSESDTGSNNELIVGDDDVNAWLNQGKDCYRGWGYCPLACLMSHFLGCPIQLTDIIKHISPKLASWGVRGKITIPWIL